MPISMMRPHPHYYPARHSDATINKRLFLNTPIYVQIAREPLLTDILTASTHHLPMRQALIADARRMVPGQAVRVGGLEEKLRLTVLSACRTERALSPIKINARITATAGGDNVLRAESDTDPTSGAGIGKRCRLLQPGGAQLRCLGATAKQLTPADIHCS